MHFCLPADCSSYYNGILQKYEVSVKKQIIYVFKFTVTIDTMFDKLIIYLEDEPLLLSSVVSYLRLIVFMAFFLFGGAVLNSLLMEAKC